MADDESFQKTIITIGLIHSKRGIVDRKKRFKNLMHISLVSPRKHLRWVAQHG